MLLILRNNPNVKLTVTIPNGQNTLDHASPVVAPHVELAPYGPGVKIPSEAPTDPKVDDRRGPALTKWSLGFDSRLVLGLSMVRESQKGISMFSVVAV